jgi:hypothetical protein
MPKPTTKTTVVLDAKNGRLLNAMSVATGQSVDKLVNRILLDYAIQEACSYTGAVEAKFDKEVAKLKRKGQWS